MSEDSRTPKVEQEIREITTQLWWKNELKPQVLLAVYCSNPSKDKLWNEYECQYERQSNAMNLPGLQRLPQEKLSTTF